jgi:hypothetical protein
LGAKKDDRETLMAGHGSYFKKHTESLVKDVGIEPACKLTGKSKAASSRYYFDHPEPSDGFMQIDTVINLEKAAGYPHATSAHLCTRKPSIKFSAKRWSEFLYYFINSKSCNVFV